MTDALEPGQEIHTVECPDCRGQVQVLTERAANNRRFTRSIRHAEPGCELYLTHNRDYENRVVQQVRASVLRGAPTAAPQDKPEGDPC